MSNPSLKILILPIYPASGFSSSSGAAMALRTPQPSYQTVSPSSISQPYIKSKHGLKFILGPSDNPAVTSTTTNDHYSPYRTRSIASAPSRKTRYSFPRPLPSQGANHYGTMSTGSGSGSGGFNDDDWKNITNDKERRKVQNRNAQRRHSRCTFPGLSPCLLHHAVPNIGHIFVCLGSHLLYLLEAALQPSLHAC